MIPEMEPLITKAYFLADKLHNGQKRDSGKPYTWHTNKVADLLCLVTNDPTIVAAGYLHDVLEVTKKGENCFPNLKSRDAFLIKFADRLQNLSDMVTWNDGRKQRYMNKSIFWLQTPVPNTEKNR
jgi:(p)ppGpp synthase/HD superfamily hydrolase